MVVNKIQGANAPELANKVAEWAGPNTSVREASPASLGFAAGSNVIEAVKKDLAPHSYSPLCCSLRVLQNNRAVTAALGSATSYLRHAMRSNSLTTSQRNISQH